MSSERFFIVSLILHILIVAILLQSEPVRFPSKETIEVVVLENSQQKRQTFVTDPNLQPLKKAVEDLKKKADFLSRETRRVKEETVARKTGETRNAEPQTSTRAFPKPHENTDLDGTAPGFGQQRAAERVVLSDSTIAEYIPDVKQGGFTSLNTDQFMYYTFYARINEQIRNRWVSNLRTFADSAGPVELNRLSGREQITELEVILDKEGNYKRTIYHRRSENPRLDHAASYAIQNASPFLNPPSEIVEKDGDIHLYYQFHINWRPRYVARPN